MTFVFELANKLSCNLCVCLAVKLNAFKEFLFDFGMSTNDAIVNNKYISVCIEMRMSISLYFFTTGSPPSMPDTHMGPGNIFSDFLYKSLDAVNCLLRLLGLLDHFDLNIFPGAREGHYSGTVITSILE